MDRNSKAINKVFKILVLQAHCIKKYELPSQATQNSSSKIYLFIDHYIAL